MVNTLKPDVLQMLVIGKDCGLSQLGEAVANYMNHYDCFFLISDFINQQTRFISDLINLKLIELDLNGSLYIKEITIDEALNITFPEYKYEELTWPALSDSASEIKWP
jgi:hypothetical protein